MFDYTTSITRRYYYPGVIDSAGHMSRSTEKKYIKTLDYMVSTPILDRNIMRDFVTTIYPEVMSSMDTDTRNIGVRVTINGNKTVKAIVSRDSSLSMVQRQLLSSYVSVMELDNIFGGDGR